MVTNYPCPCCSYKTFDQEANGSHEICPVCFWEDDLIQLDDPDFEGGANPTSLRQAQQNFLAFGACERKMLPNVRQPAEDEQKRRRLETDRLGSRSSSMFEFYHPVICFTKVKATF